MSTLSVGTIKSATTSPPEVQNSAGTEIGTFCRAWVNFNGTGTVAIRAAFNVSSITDGGTGIYTINFTDAFADENYAAVFGVHPGAANVQETNTIQGYSTVPSTSSLKIRASQNSSGASIVDHEYCWIAIFR